MGSGVKQGEDFDLLGESRWGEESALLLLKFVLTGAFIIYWRKEIG